MADTRVTRDSLVRKIRESGLDEFDADDAAVLVDVLLEGFTAVEALTLLYWPDTELEGTPIILIGEGQIRRVTQRMRRLVAERS